MSACLTEDQKRKIEENRQKALARRAERLASLKRTAAVSSDAQASNPQQLGGNLRQNFNAQDSGPNNNTFNPFSLHSVGGANGRVAAQTAQSQLSNTRTEAKPPCQNAPANVDSINRLHFGATAAPNQNHEPSKSLHGTFGAGKTSATPVQSNVSQFYGCKLASTAGNKATTDGREKAAGGCGVSDVAQTKKPTMIVKGRCVKHAEDRFRVEVGYKAELISLFKTIPSKNYGKLMM